MHVGMWRPEVGIACLPLLLFSHWFICFQTRSLAGLELAGLSRLTGRQDPGVLWSLPLQHQDDRHTQPYRLFYARTKVLMFAWQASFGPSHLPSAGSLLCMVKGRDFDGVRKVLPD